MFKRIVSLILCIPVFACFGFSSFAVNSEAKLYSVYGDGMLFQQKEDAVFSGTASSNTLINIELYNSKNILIAQSNSTANKDNTFSVSFKAPQGSFEEYTVVLSANAKEFARLESIVFGELWLASGQSNMMYPLGQSKTGREMMENGEKLSKWIRVLMEPAYPKYNGKDSLQLVPVDPQPDIIGAKWIDGEDDKIYSMSAVASFFAMDLLTELNMPIGILNSSLGGSAIASWISREAIDNCPEVKSIISSHGYYTEKSDWNESEQSIYYDITSNFNLRTNALKNFRPSGMIWYQGETDLMYGYSPEEYTAQLELLQSFYTEHFSYKNGLLPLVYTQLAPYMYSDKGFNLLDWNIEYTKFQTESPDSRAVVTNYDVPLTFIKESGFIHPECKKEIGQRMAFAAKGLVYEKTKNHSAAYPEKIEISDSDIYVTFNNTLDGLKVKGNTIYGFAISESNGIYIQADAEIVNENTVRVYADSFSNPVSVSYAYCVGNQRANLYSSYSNELIMPVSPFVCGTVDSNAHHWIDKPWADCEDSLLRHNFDDTFAGTYRSWKSENAKISFDNSNAYSGTNGLCIISQENKFTVNPLLTYKDGASVKSFQDYDSDYTDYGTMSFYIRNNGNSPVALDNVTFYKNAVTCYTPVNNQTGDVKTIIPADGKWHLISLDLNTLYVPDYNSNDTFSNNLLDDVTDIKFNFSSEGESNISLDNIRFDAETEEATSSFCGSFLERIHSFIEMIFRLINIITG